MNWLILETQFISCKAETVRYKYHMKIHSSNINWLKCRPFSISVYTTQLCILQQPHNEPKTEVHPGHLLTAPKGEELCIMQQRVYSWSCLCARHEGIWGSGGIAPLILNIDTA
jgi:hypothetical protein